jgi:murein DD-endopeptidase MepM/ murein hydrolase activator NlpD
MTRQLSILVCCLLLLLGCARGQPPAPVVRGQNDTQSTAPASTGQPRQAPEQDRNTAARQGSTARPSAGGGSSLPATAPRRDLPGFDPRNPRGRAGIHTVARGETVYGIARQYQVPLRAVIDANDLEPPYVLRIGQRLRVPVPRRHVVQKGDTLYGISRAYGVDLHELPRINRLAPPYTIKPQQLLIVPGASGSPADGSSTAVASASDEPESGPKTSARTGSPPTDSSGSSEDQDTASTGQDDGGQETRTADSGANLDAAPSARDSDATQQASVSPPDPKEIPKPAPRAAGHFLWPVKGDILARFGPQDDGLHNDGINIAAARGTTIKAAENGVVAYVGNELRGFGNLLLIKHADDWITAYAHADRILVARGDKVRRGESIARVGTTGGVSRPQLHFEVRQGSRAVDPLKVLVQQQAMGNVF